VQVGVEAKVARVKVGRKLTPISVKQYSLISRNIVFRKSVAGDSSLAGSQHKIICVRCEKDDTTSVLQKNVHTVTIQLSPLCITSKLQCD
jgi:hypothetical protein